MKRADLYRAYWRIGMTTREIAAKFGVSHQCVSQACGGRVAHLERERRQRADRTGRPIGKYTCSLCGGAGHAKTTCAVRREAGTP
jgi:hypothetical protein